MSEKTREICTVVSQESIGAGIYSMWIQTDRIAADAKPGQFVSLYTNDKSKILPRPISLCEIDKENGRLHLVYRVTGQGTGTDEFSQMKAGDTIPVLGPLGNGFPVEKAEGKKVFLMGVDYAALKGKEKRSCMATRYFSGEFIFMIFGLLTESLRQIWKE